jgi:hypothetical protein
MSAESTLNAALLGAAGVTALVADRVYPDILPQGKPLPAVVYARTDTEYVTTIHSNATRATIVTLETWCFAKSRPAAESLADAVEVALASSGLRPVGRNPDYDTDTDTYSSVITCTAWT